MRLVIIFIFIAFINSCINDTTHNGIWYHNKFGFLYINDFSATHYSVDCIVPHLWTYDSDKKAFAVDDTFYQPCKKRLDINEDIYVHTKDKGKNLLLLNSDHPCFKFSNNEDVILLRKFSDVYDSLDYKALYTRININDEISNIWIDRDELLNLDSCNNLLSLDQQLWVIFESGGDYYSESQSHIIMSAILSIKGNTYYKSKTVNTYPNPCYLRPLMDHLINSASNQ